jgi:5-methylcytosine-specific restriction protein A
VKGRTKSRPFFFGLGEVVSQFWKCLVSKGGVLLPTRPKNPCPVCRRLGCTNPTHHREKLDDWRERRRRRPYNHAERVLKEKVVKEWVAVYGWVCPGYQCPSHPSTDLTADHIVPIVAGGDPLGPMQVLCRRCNSRKGNDEKEARKKSKS